MSREAGSLTPYFNMILLVCVGLGFALSYFLEWYGIIIEGPIKLLIYFGPLIVLIFFSVISELFISYRDKED